MLGKEQIVMLGEVLGKSIDQIATVHTQSSRIKEEPLGIKTNDHFLTHARSKLRFAQAISWYASSRTHLLVTFTPRK